MNQHVKNYYLMTTPFLLLSNLFNKDIKSTIGIFIPNS
jgi:hypothetical protein